MWIIYLKYITSANKVYNEMFNLEYISIVDYDHLLEVYSLVGLIWPNTEELISRPFMGLWKIRLLLQDRMRTKNVRN